jgi:hypothetical protein
MKRIMWSNHQLKRIFNRKKRQMSSILKEILISKIVNKEGIHPRKKRIWIKKIRLKAILKLQKRHFNRICKALKTRSAVVAQILLAIVRVRIM